ncbi:hypothetical protein PMF13cell1_04483 [Blautia producta]|uniref:Uncharacterized protein n=1 Tax=Blautia producta TaxID=33035 RepID=A0A4P6M1F5_9FIRM|nr:NPCBM/NEW2 domain-containing protein [Blautia producta]QBE98914.1 hypothetical protein PMF13cell1_04483 [Blautia producta]
MKKKVVIAMIEGLFAVMVACITAYGGYRAGANNVKQKIDNKVSQVVEVDNGNVGAAIDYIISQNEKLEKENSELKNETQKLKLNTELQATSSNTKNEENEPNTDEMKKIDFLSVCEPYNEPSGFFYLGKNRPFKIQSKTYSDGISLDAYYQGLRNVKFNLENKYSQLTFNIGHIDDTNENNDALTFTLNIYVDEELKKQILCDENFNIDEEQTVDLEKGKTLKLEWICDRIENGYFTSYGLINMKVI